MCDISRFIPDPEQAVLLVVDIQERLFAAMADEVQKKMLRNSGILIKGAGELNIPLLLWKRTHRGM